MKESADVKGKILMADDEPDIVEFVKWQLETLSYTVHTASNGSEALNILRNIHDIEVLIADIRMPGMDGIELIREAVALRPDIQCIVMTGHGGIETAIEAMKLGAINYLRKPVGVEELDISIQKGLERLRLIQAVREKQARLEQANKELEAANKELTKLRHQLEDALEKETEDRKKAEDALKKAQLRELLVEVMTLSLRYWKQTTQKTKIELAEESKVWTASIDSGGTYRTRTLDRYLRINTLPANPRSGEVLDTAYFVLTNCPPDPEIKAKLEEKTKSLEKMLLEAS